MKTSRPSVGERSMIERLQVFQNGLDVRRVWEGASVYKSVSVEWLDWPFLDDWLE